MKRTLVMLGLAAIALYGGVYTGMNSGSEPIRIQAEGTSPPIGG